MITEDDKRTNDSSINESAGRDGNKVESTSQRPERARYSSRTEQGESHSRPRYTSAENTGERSYRPRYNSDESRSQRGYRSNNSDNRGEQSQSSYRPRYNNGGGYGNDRQQSTGGYRSNSASDSARDPYNQYANNDRSERPRTPSYANREEGERSYRPRTNSYNNDRGGYRPRTNSYNNDRGGSSDRGGYNNDRGGGYSSNRGGYNNDRGGSSDRGGYNNDRGGYSYNRGGYNNNRGGSNNDRGGYNNDRSESNNDRGGYNTESRRPSYSSRPSQNEDRGALSAKKQIEYKQPVHDPNETIRLNKYLANAGVCSRREADEYITTGAICVNGVVAKELGTKVRRTDEIKFRDELVSIERKIYVLLNKPKDCVTTVDDPQERTTVLDLVKGACDERIYPVGRLDRNTTGVLLLTNDGDLASKLTHPKFMKKKIYHVFTDKPVTNADMDQIANGITLDDGVIQPDGLNYVDDKRNQVGLEIHSGKNRVVRRIFESLGYRVVKLDRVLFAGLTKKGLRRGDWRFLTENEVSFLRMGSFE